MTMSHQSTSSQNRVRLKKEFEFSLLSSSPVSSGIKGNFTNFAPLGKVTETN